MAEFSLSAATNLFKIKYDKLSENVYNSANVMMARMKKRFDFTGRQMFVPVPVSFQGGVGSGSLPTPNVADYQDALITAKKVYSVVQVEREAIKASMNSEGAFVQATKEVAQKGVESWMRNGSRILFGDGTGLLGQGDGTGANVSGTGTTVDPYIVEIPSSSWKEANWEERDFVNVVTGLPAGTAETTSLEIVAVVPGTRLVSLVGTSVRLAALTGVGPLAATDGIAMQNSYGNDPIGLKGVLDATTGSLYSIAVARRWQATQVAAGGAGLTTDQMNQIMLEVQRKSGKIPNLIVTSFVQYRKLLNLLEDQKQIIVEPRAQDLRGKVAFKALEYISSAGSVAVIPERFCEDDRMYFLNDNFITGIHRPDFGWFDDDGTVFLRTTSDSYDARYGGYYENYIVPSFHGVLTGLAT